MQLLQINSLQPFGMIPAEKFNGVAFLPCSIDIATKRSSMMEEKQIPKYVHDRNQLETKSYYKSIG